jgi:hypothetical protein
LIREEIVSGLLRPMHPLDVPVPPMLAGALGYDRPADLAARFVAFYWKESGDELMWDDGRNTSTASWLGWSAYTEHSTTSPHFQELQRQGVYFGGAGAVASHYFLLDRHKHRVYAGRLLNVVRLLSLQHAQRVEADRGSVQDSSSSIDSPQAEHLRRKTLSQLMETLGQALEKAAHNSLSPAEEKRLPEVQELERRVKEQRKMETDMMRWLDEYSGGQRSSGEEVE